VINLVTGIIIGFFIGCIFTFLLTFKAFIKLKHNYDNPIIKLNNEDECTIEEFNEMISNHDCCVCYRYCEVDSEDEKCSTCLNGDNYISYFDFVGIKSINDNYEIYKEEN
jgi:hypothetical protein